MQEMYRERFFEEGRKFLESLKLTVDQQDNADQHIIGLTQEDTLSKGLLESVQNHVDTNNNATTVYFEFSALDEPKEKIIEDIDGSSIRWVIGRLSGGRFNDSFNPKADCGDKNAKGKLKEKIKSNEKIFKCIIRESTKGSASPTSTTTTEKSKKLGTTEWVIIGITIATFVIATVVVSIVFCVRKSKKHPKKPVTKEYSEEVIHTQDDDVGSLDKDADKLGKKNEDLGENESAEGYSGLSQIPSDRKPRLLRSKTAQWVTFVVPEDYKEKPEEGENVVIR